MIITCRTPLRVSFFGGGTDYPEYFERDRGAVVGFSIDQYIYITALKLRSFLDYKYQVSYSKLEKCQKVADIQHPVVRSVLEEFDIDIPLHISSTADLPSGSGLGSSSAFTVGFINLVSQMTRRMINKIDLAEKAVYFERGVLQEHVGVQDQYHAAFGGINRFDFTKDRTRISPIQIYGDCQKVLTDHMVLVYTGITRSASDAVDDQISRTKKHTIDKELGHLLRLVDDGVSVMEKHNPDDMIRSLGELLHEGWMTKRSLSKNISNEKIDHLYDTARQCGALGGKLCGAGNGGFFFLLVPPENQMKLAEALSPLTVIPINVDTLGSTIIYENHLV
jgi:D-glycero-alpha-D-manno-heptose-7-phosphate kinase